MKVEILIVSLEKIDTILPASFPCGGGKRKVLTDEYTVVTVDERPKRPDGKDEDIPEYRLNFTTRQDTKKITYNVGKDGKPLTDIDKAIKKTVDEFYAKHPLTLFNGARHENTKSPMFDVVDANVKAMKDMDLWQKQLKVGNYLSESDNGELRDIAFYLGEDPKDRNVGNLLLYLADFSEGVIFIKKNDKGVPYYDLVIDAFINNSDPLRKYKINARKAIDLKIIKTQIKNDAATYYLNQDFVGADVNQVVEFFKQNEKIYNDFVVKEIARIDPYQDDKTAIYEPKSIRDAAGDDPLSTGILRAKVMGLIDDLESAKIDPGVKKGSLSNAGAKRLQEVYDELIPLIDKATA